MKLISEMQAFRIGRDVPKEEPVWGTYLYGSNLWPTLPDHEFKTPAMKYRDHMLRLATEILKILARGLPCSDDVFNDFMQDPVASVKLLHYPPQEDDGCEAIGGELSLKKLSLQGTAAFGSCCHTDCCI